MKLEKYLYVLLAVCLIVFGIGCPGDDDDDDNGDDTPEEYYWEEDIDNSSLETVGAEDTFVIGNLEVGGASINSGDTVESRVLNISGTIPESSSLLRNSEALETERIHLHADGGSCMQPGPWNDQDTFTIDFAQTVGLSYENYGVMCTGDHGFEVTIKDLSDNILYHREVNQGIGMDIDTEEGSKNLPAGTYIFHASAVTGTDTYANLTYTPGTGGAISSSIVVYHNGELYEVAEASPGSYYDYTIDLVRGGNVIRVLVIGNFDSAARQDIANILGVSDINEIYCMTDELAIRCVLSWSIDNSDVDLHLLAPGGLYTTVSDCYFGNMNPEWGDSSTTIDNPSLDFDNTSGFGPETIVLPSPTDGIYTVLVHYWSDHGGGDAPSQISVTLNESENRTFGPRTITDGEIWIVTGIEVTSGTASFTAAPDSMDLMPALLKPVTK